MAAQSQRTHTEMVTVRTGIRKLTPARKQQQQGLRSHSEQKCLFPSRKISKTTGGRGERHAMDRKKNLFSQNSVICYSGNNSSSLAKQKTITIFLNDLWTTKRKVIQKKKYLVLQSFLVLFYKWELLQQKKISCLFCTFFTDADFFNCHADTAIHYSPWPQDPDKYYPNNQPVHIRI